MLFEHRQTVQEIDLEKIILFPKKLTQYLRRSCGLDLYFREIHELTFNAPDNMKNKVFLAYKKRIINSFELLLPMISEYYLILFEEMGFSNEEASQKTWKMFVTKIEEFAKVYHELYEIDHYLHMIKSPTLTVL
jgi:hypothetical protein